MNGPANRAALAFRAALEAADIPGVLETTTALVSACVIFDPAVVGHDVLRNRVAFLPVRPDWRESTELWGNYNPEGRSIAWLVT